MFCEVYDTDSLICTNIHMLQKRDIVSICCNRVMVICDISIIKTQQYEVNISIVFFLHKIVKLKHSVKYSTNYIYSLCCLNLIYTASISQNIFDYLQVRENQL